MSSPYFSVKLVATEIATTPHPDVVFKSVGIRKSLSTFMSHNYVQNLTQCILGVLNRSSGSFLIGGDGRACTASAIDSVVQVLAGNGMRRAVVAQHGLMTAAMATCLMKVHECHAAFFFTAGHFRGGEDGCFGLKIISPPGYPFPPPRAVKVTRLAETIVSFMACEELSCDLSQLGVREFLVSNKKFTLEVVDPVEPYCQLLKEMFDFPALKQFLKEDFKILIDCSNGACCVAARRLFAQELGVAADGLWGMNRFVERGPESNPDPNPTLCRDVVEHTKAEKCNFAAVLGGDGARCMIVGEGGFLVAPSDSLSVVAAHSDCIPFFLEKPVKMFVRSVCTSNAIDSLSRHASLPCLEVLPGWTTFTPALLPQPHSSVLFGEESYGLGFNGFCDRDGIWTILAWLSIMCHTKLSARTIVEEHWRMFGRTFFMRYDYEKIPDSHCDELVSFLENTQFLRFKKKKIGSFENVEYLDPFGIDPKLRTEEEKKRDVEVVYEIENYVSPYGFIGNIKDEHHKVFQIRLSDQSRAIVRRSESTYGLSTIRLYIEYTVESEDDTMHRGAQEVLAPFVEAALKMTKIREFTGRHRPTLIK